MAAIFPGFPSLIFCRFNGEKVKYGTWQHRQVLPKRPSQGFRSNSGDQDWRKRPPTILAFRQSLTRPFLLKATSVYFANNLDYERSVSGSEKQLSPGNPYWSCSAFRISIFSLNASASAVRDEYRRMLPLRWAWNALFTSVSCCFCHFASGELLNSPNTIIILFD